MDPSSSLSLDPALLALGVVMAAFNAAGILWYLWDEHPVARREVALARWSAVLPFLLLLATLLLRDAFQGGAGGPRLMAVARLVEALTAAGVMAGVGALLMGQVLYIRRFMDGGRLAYLGVSHATWMVGGAHVAASLLFTAALAGGAWTQLGLLGAPHPPGNAVLGVLLMLLGLMAALAALLGLICYGVRHERAMDRAERAQQARGAR